MITTYDDIETLRGTGELSTAEEQLLADCQVGEETILGDGTLPASPDEDRVIRAGILRYLITGGCAGYRVHDRGVRLQGAYVTDALDLSFAGAKGATKLVCCRFDSKVIALQARFEFLNLARSHLPGLNVQGAKVLGDVFLRDGFTAMGEVSLQGAEIDGQLTCKDGTFVNAGGTALNAQNLLADELYWRGIKTVTGKVVLAGAQIGNLIDEAPSWEKADDLRLNGFRYDHIHGPADAAMRLAWVAKGALSNGEFQPQPYEQLAKVLRSMGHTEDSRKVLLEKERRLNHDRRDRIWQRHAARAQTGWRGAILHQMHDAVRWLKDGALAIKDMALTGLVGYGYYPQRSVYWLAALFVAAVFIFDAAYRAGAFAPNSGVILSSRAWQDLAEDATVANPAVEWTLESGKGRDYETFNRYAYALDVVVPVISLGQQEAWAPSTTRGGIGWFAWWARWVFQIGGWIVTALGAAAITGFIRRE